MKIPVVLDAELVVFPDYIQQNVGALEELSDALHLHLQEIGEDHVLLVTDQMQNLIFSNWPFGDSKPRVFGDIRKILFGKLQKNTQRYDDLIERMTVSTVPEEVLWKAYGHDADILQAMEGLLVQAVREFGPEGSFLCFCTWPKSAIVEHGSNPMTISVPEGNPPNNDPTTIKVFVDELDWSESQEADLPPSVPDGERIHPDLDRQLQGNPHLNHVQVLGLNSFLKRVFESVPYVRRFRGDRTNPDLSKLTRFKFKPTGNDGNIYLIYSDGSRTAGLTVDVSPCSLESKHAAIKHLNNKFGV